METSLRYLMFFVLGLTLSACATLAPGKSATTFEAPILQVYESSLAVLEEEGLPIISKKLDAANGMIRAKYLNEAEIRIDIKKIAPRYTEVLVVVRKFRDHYRSNNLLGRIEGRLTERLQKE